MSGTAVPRLVLASSSQARLRLLRSAGFAPDVVVSGVDETTDERLETAELVAVLAERKAAAVAASRPGALILGCDSLLDVDGDPCGKPTSAASGEPMSLAGAFSIDGLGAPFVEGIDGDPGNVLGLSLPLLRRMLTEVGLAITDLWQPISPK